MSGRVNWRRCKGPGMPFHSIDNSEQLLVTFEHILIISQLRYFYDICRKNT